MVKQGRLDPFLTPKREDMRIEEKVRIGEKMPYELPDGWKWVRLGSICEKITDGTHGSPKHVMQGVPLLTAKNITYGQLVFDDFDHTTQEELKIFEKRMGCKKGDVLLTIVGTIGKTAVVKEDLRVVFLRSVCIIRPTENLVDSNFLAYVLRSKTCQDQMVYKTKQVAQPGIYLREVRSLQIPFPPLEEQKRMVARIEELVNRVEEARRLKKVAREEAEKIMQSVLNKVFSRGEEDGWDKVMLKKIVYIRKDTLNPQEYPSEKFELYSIPAYHKNGMPEVKLGKDIRSVKVVVQPNDCLFGKLNPHLPKVWLVEPSKGRRQIASTELFPLVPKISKVVLPNFLFWFLKTSYIKDRMVRKVIGTTASRKRLSKDNVFDEPIRLPPLEEQKRIVAYLDRVSKIRDSLEKFQRVTEEELEELVPAILDIASKGEL